MDVEFNLADLFEAVVDTVPDQLAVVAGPRRLTYVELDERASRLASVLAAAGVAPDDTWGQAVCAVVEPRPGCTPGLEDLREAARATLSGYKLPKRLVIVDHVVRSPSGKADYRWAAAVASGR